MISQERRLTGQNLELLYLPREVSHVGGRLVELGLDGRLQTICALGPGDALTGPDLVREVLRPSLYRFGVGQS